MEERKWEELNIDCLINIISKVGYTEDLLDSVPFVCKSWYDATLDPKSWEFLLFPNREVSIEYIKSVVARSQHTANVIFFRRIIPIDGFIHISNDCPELKVLALSEDIIRIYSSQISEHIGKFKHLENFGKFPCHRVAGANAKHFAKILESISFHCPKIKSLCWLFTSFSDDDISSIIKFLPKIELLNISGGSLLKNHVMMLLKGCKELENFQLIKCVGFNGDDDEIKKLASHIKSFSCTGSIVLDHSLTDTYRAFVENFFQIDVEQIRQMAEDFEFLPLSDSEPDSGDFEQWFE